MAEQNRGDRAHHERRAFARRQQHAPGYVPKYAGKTPGKYCSCVICGNARAWDGPTRQERESARSEREQREEL